MKTKLLITIFSALLFIVCLVLGLKAENHSALDKWTSFGMGFTAPVCIMSVISLIIGKRAQRARAEA
jgi:hypothetical protein